MADLVVADPGGAPPDVRTLATAIAWRRAGHAVQLVTVASTWGSAPRPPGAFACVRGDGAIIGSVSGGCIERELAEQRSGTQAGAGTGTSAAATRPAAQAIRITDETARRVGLTCGGRLELVFETIDDAAPLQELVDALEARQRRVRTIDLLSGTATLRPWQEGDAFAWDGRTLVRPFGPDWRAVLVGAGELSLQVAQLAGQLDFEVILCDPRAPFRTAVEHAAVHVAEHAAVHIDAPSSAPPRGGITVLDALPDDAVAAHASDARSAVLALAHDPVLDDLALQQALEADCFYIGALGSRRSHTRRCERLLSLGVASDALARIRAPIGLDIGSRTTAEIALSIVAELVQARALAMNTAQSRVRFATA